MGDFKPPIRVRLHYMIYHMRKNENPAMSYETFISSEKWRKSPVRLAELDSAGNRCRICFDEAEAGSPIEVHHATYERLGREAIGDLLALCGRCHREVTCFLRRRSYGRRSPRRADVPRLRDIRRPLFDPTR
jgi:hypothetical protein